MRIANIASEHLELTFNIVCAMVKPSPRIEGILMHKGTDFMALSNQGFGQVRANETVGACDENG
jgi:hypothetical protein